MQIEATDLDFFDKQGGKYLNKGEKEKIFFIFREQIVDQQVHKALNPCRFTTKVLAEKVNQLLSCAPFSVLGTKEKADEVIDPMVGV